MSGRWSQGDLLAGTLAVVVLLLLVYALDVNPIAAILLAVATYVGIVLVLPRRASRLATPEADPALLDDGYRSALASAAAIRALASGVAKPAVREQVDRISDNIDRVLKAIREDDNLSAAPAFSDILLATYEPELDRYVLLSTREVRSAGEGLRTFESRVLPIIEQAVDAFYERLHRDRVVDLAALSEVLMFNLESITSPPEQTPAEPAPALPSANGDAPPAVPEKTDAAVSPEAALYGLTAREVEILPLLAQRLTDREIADQLCISRRTVENHVLSIRGKLGLSSRREVADFIKEHNLLPPSPPPDEDE